MKSHAHKQSDVIVNIPELTTNQKIMRVLKCQCCKKPKLEGEEDDDWSVILTPRYSSGESDDDESKEEFKALPEA